LSKLLFLTLSFFLGFLFGLCFCLGLFTLLALLLLLCFLFGLGPLERFNLEAETFLFGCLFGGLLLHASPLGLQCPLLHDLLLLCKHFCYTWHGSVYRASNGSRCWYGVGEDWSRRE